MTDKLYNWFVELAYPGIVEFITPLLPWIGLALTATLFDWKLSSELYKIRKGKDVDKPRAMRYLNKMINCVLLVLLAGFCRITIGVELGVQVVSMVVLIAFACFEVTRCFNKFMQIENTGKKLNLFNLFKGTQIHSVIEIDKEDKK